MITSEWHTDQLFPVGCTAAFESHHFEVLAARAVKGMLIEYAALVIVSSGL